MLLRLASRVGVLTAAAASVAMAAAPSASVAAADDDREAPATGKRPSPAAQAAAALLERRRRRQQQQEEEEQEQREREARQAAEEAAAAKAAAAAAAAAAPPPALPLEPCPERACRGAQDMLAAFAEVRARLKQQEQDRQEKQLPQQQQQTPESELPSGGSYLWWAEALGGGDGDGDGGSSPPAAPCPPDTAEIGRAAWTVLHSVAAYYPERPSFEDREALRGLVHGLARLYPCAECRAHLPAELAAASPAMARPGGAEAEAAAGAGGDAASSRAAAEQWACSLHNAVNVRLGKPAYDCSRVGERWRDGWRDGSCGEYPPPPAAAPEEEAAAAGGAGGGAGPAAN